MATAIDFDVLGMGHDIDVRECKLVYQSFLEMKIVATDGRGAWDRLMACVEDNILDDDELGEYIDWRAVQSDYEASQ